VGPGEARGVSLSAIIVIRGFVTIGDKHKQVTHFKIAK